LGEERASRGSVTGSFCAALLPQAGSFELEANYAAIGWRTSGALARTIGCNCKTCDWRVGWARRRALPQTEQVNEWPVRRWPHVAQNKYW
jgi:hypothetical protein